MADVFQNDPLKKSGNIAELSAYMHAEMERAARSDRVAAWLAITLGILGIHKFYLRRPISGIAYCVPTASVAFVYFSYFREGAAAEYGWAIIGAFGVLIMIFLFNVARLIRDIYTIRTRVEHANERMEKKILEELEDQ